MTGPTLATPVSARVCPDCDGFASAAVSSGDRDASGQLPTVAVDCPACHGTGTVPLRPRLTSAALEVAA